MRKELGDRAAEASTGPIPGTQPDSQSEFIYIEARPGETALTHRRAVAKAYRAALKAGIGIFPQSGLMGTTRWQLELPTGEVFFALCVGGDKEAWLSALRRCATSAGRMAGRIVDWRSFVLEDGRRFPLADCKCTRVKE